MCKESRMDRTKINIGTYYLAPYASSEAHVKELAECGIDFVVNMRYDLSVLDRFEKYGVGAVVTGILPGWFGGNGSNAGTMSSSNPMEKYLLAAESFTDHPAIWGIDTGDEPSSLDFPYYGEIFKQVKNGFEKKIPYLNIYPSYGVKGSNTPEEVLAQLGTKNYQEYIDAFCNNVDSNYICFDYYLYSADIKGLYETLKIVSDTCVRKRLQMWMVLQVNSHQEDVWISEEQLRFQANCALAFGAEVITWACYTAGWWYNHVLDKQGNKTKQYERLKKVNSEIHALSEEYMKYRHVETHFVGQFEEDELSGTGCLAESVLNTFCYHDFKVSDGGKLLIGLRCVGTKGCADYKEALMICPASDPYGENKGVCQISFKAGNKKIRALGSRDWTTLTLCEDETYLLDIRSNEGILLVEE